MKASFFANQGNFFFQDVNTKENSSFYQGLTQVIDSKMYKTLNKIKTNDEFVYYIEFFNGFLKIKTNEDFKNIQNNLLINHIKHETINNSIYIVKNYEKSELKKILKLTKNNYISTIFEKDLEIFYNVEELILNFDVKPIYDNSSFGKNYIVEKNKNDINIFFINESTNFTKNIKIVTKNDFQILNDWVLERYSIENRRSKSNEMKERFTRDLLKFSGIGELKLNLDLKEKESIFNTKTLNKIYKSNYEINKCFTLNNIEKLYNNENFYAGFPWFFQSWARDSLISILYLKPFLKESLYKKIVIDYLNKINSENPLSLSNITDFQSELKSYDSIFWLYKNLIDNFQIFNEDQKNEIINKAIKIIESIKLDDNNMIFNNPKETWMDTDYNDNGRMGYAIEIQLGYLMILDFLKNNGYKYHDKIENTKKSIKEFTKNKYLIDSINNNEFESNIRPNFILGSVFYPQFLEKNILKTYKTISEKLLCESGISSVSKDSKLYCKFYTGEDNRSYHRGDSWMFINNITKKILKDVDENFFNEIIKRISLVNDKLINVGVFGALNEVSSSEIISIDGSIVQLWSMATYL